MNKPVAVILTGTFICSPLLRGQEGTDLQAAAYRNSIAQDEVRRQTSEVREALILLLQDFYQNQLQTKGLAEAQKVAEQLASLTDEQILPVIAMLKEAGTTGEGVEGKLLTASQGQKKIQVDLKSLEARLSLHLALASTAQRLQQLAVRQAANLRQTKDLQGTGKPGNKLPSNLASVFGLCQSEQGALKEEIAVALGSMEQVVAEAPVADRPGFAEALEEAKKIDLSGRSVTAADTTQAGKFDEAVGAQTGVLDGLQAMLMKLRQNQSAQERVEAMQEKYQQLADAQKQLAEATKTADDAGKREIREAQNKLADQVAALDREAASLNAAAAQQAQQAAKEMDQAADALANGAKMKPEEKKSAADAQNKAAGQMQAAADALQQQARQLAAQNSAPQNAAQTMQALSQLDQQVRTAMTQQQNLAGQPNAQAQQQQANQISALQQQALPMSPQAAQQLGQAAQAQQQQNPQQAAQALAQASQAIQQQMQNLNQAMNDQKQLQALATQLQAAQNQTQQAGQALGQPGQQDLTPAIQQMQQAQQALQQAQAQAGNAPGAQQAMQEAGKNLEASIMSAAQKKQDPAAASNGQAQQAIGQAMSAVSQAMAQAQAQAQAAAPAMAQAGPQPPMPGQMMPGQQMQPNGQIQDGHSSEGIFGGVQGFMANSGPNGANGQVNAGLKPKDRDAIAQLKKEKTPVEYQGMSQQYLKNLAEGSYPAGAAE